MKKAIALLLALLCLGLWGCGEEPVDYASAILGTWYAVEYESEVVEFREDGIVADTFSGNTDYGNYIVDNENARIWVNFGDDVFSMEITEEEGRLIILDNNGTLVREEDRDAYREAYQAKKAAAKAG
ncbi:MAG: hypothetical protein IJ375_01150 [Oscillospiraceae bacterium]|nr:hypothetical protein [Oscillospiraceae bacterium]